jgi:hypothetical protein
MLTGILDNICGSSFVFNSSIKVLNNEITLLVTYHTMQELNLAKEGSKSVGTLDYSLVSITAEDACRFTFTNN